MTSLLQKSFRSFLIYTAIVLACSIPAYFYIVDRIWEHELKEHNLIVATGVRHHVESLNLDDSTLHQHLEVWNRMQPERQITKVDAVRPDSTYNVYRVNTLTAHKKEDRFQGLVSYFVMNGKPYSLTVETNMEESYETILGLSIVTVLFFILLLSGLIIINRRLSARIWKPFYHTLESITHFDLDRQQPITFGETEILEFAALNTGLNKLIVRNITTYQQQKHFIENAAHELQTPLAVIQSKLDVFLQDESLSGKQSNNIEQAQYALSRAGKINKNLLLLAKIENSQFPETTTVNLSEILQDNLALVDSFIAEKQLRIRKDIIPDITIEANRMLVEILLSNLLLNAIRYSPQEGEIDMELSAYGFRIANTGNVSLNAEHLFKRFGSVSSEAPATGLGLAIVKQIAQQYGWPVIYTFSGQQHNFRVSFHE